MGLWAACFWIGIWGGESGRSSIKLVQVCDILREGRLVLIESVDKLHVTSTVSSLSSLVHKFTDGGPWEQLSGSTLSFYSVSRPKIRSCERY